ncbi:MAG: hypothetical protein JJU42_08390, partial [Rhodobacteraceae bacterium]|nr:hypothetical protein [Paracoccaceae bacterium]
KVAVAVGARIRGGGPLRAPVRAQVRAAGLSCSGVGRDHGQSRIEPKRWPSLRAARRGATVFLTGVFF